MNVLNIFGGTGYQLMEDTAFEKKVVAIALKEMFQPEKSFSICTIDEVINTLGVTIPEDEYRRWHMLHCKSWKTLGEEMRQEIFARVMFFLSQPTMEIDEDSIAAILDAGPRRAKKKGPVRVLTCDQGAIDI